MKKLIYTANIGEYDDTITNSEKGWDRLTLNSLVKDLGNAKSARKHKILPSFWDDYDYSVWHDANIKINVKLDDLINNYKGSDIIFVEHGRDCVYSEAKDCIERNKDSASVINSQMDYYRNIGYPEHNGLIATGFMIRKHTKKLRSLMNLWWDLVNRFSKRDQLSFNFALYGMLDTINISELPYSYYTERKLEIIKGHNKI